MRRLPVPRWPSWAVGLGGGLGLAWWAWLGVAGSPGCSHETVPASAPTAESPDALLRTDRHVAELLRGCPRSGFYDRDVSDPAPILVEKLQGSRPDPMRRAKEELGELGSRAFPGLGLAFHAFYTDPVRSPYLENVVDALAFNPSDEAHRLELEALQHPQESVRAKALDGLARNGRAEDFDVLAGRLAIETPELRRQSIGALFQADTARAEDLFLDFFTSGTERDLWLTAAPRFASTRREETARRCATLYGGLDPLLAPHLAAGAATLGDEEALGFLRRELDSEDLQRRLATITALQRAGLVDELGKVATEDPAAEARTIAVSALARAAPSEARTAWLRSALNDSAPGVRAEALLGLCVQGDEEALARALAQLDGEVAVLQPALQALRTPMRADIELARRVYVRLLERHALEEHRPLPQRSATLKAIGQVPLAEAALFLHELGVNAGDEHIESLRAHEWLMIQASNTDVGGRTRLAEILEREVDPLRRIDLIDAVGSTRDDLAREVLLRRVEDPEAASLERLFAASVLIKVGPFWDVAPRLKRVAFALTGPEEADARSGLQCLLWEWY